MTHISQKLGFHLTGFECFFASHVELNILDFDGFQGFAQILGGLIDVELKLCLGFFQ